MKFRITAVVLCAVLLFSSCTLLKEDSNNTASSGTVTESSAEKSNIPAQGSEISDESDYQASENSSSAESEPTSEEPSSPESSGESSIIQSPLCRSAVLYSVDEKKIIYDDGADIVTAPASITKLLTASVMLNNMNENDIVTVGSEQNLVHEDSSVCYISVGNRLKVKDLLTGMLLSSGNDAAYTAAVCTARAAHPGEELSDTQAVSVFCGMMNELAAEIGMSSSHFSTPDGWDEDDQYVTAADLAKLCEYALSIPTLRLIVGTFQKSVVFESGESMTWTNTNKLIDPNSNYYCEYATGMKTGTTDNAGCCLAASFVKNGKTYVSVVTGCNASDDRYEMTLKVFDKAK